MGPFRGRRVIFGLDGSRGGPHTRSRAGPAGHFCPAGPYSSAIPAPFQRYSGLVSTVGVLSAATGVRAVSIVRQCLGQTRTQVPHCTQRIDRKCTRRATARAHAAADAHVHIVDDMPAQALGCRELLLRIAHRYRLLDHRTQGRLGKCQQTHAVPTFPCS